MELTTRKCRHRRCGAHVEPPQVYCDKCRKVERDRTRQRFKDKREAGQCYRCDEPNNGRSAFCDRHQAEHLALGRQTYRNRIIRGECPRCKKKHGGEHAHCPECSAEKSMESMLRTDAFRKAGLCSRCGKDDPEPGKKMCRPCLDISNKQAKAYYHRVKSKAARQAKEAAA